MAKKVVGFLWAMGAAGLGLFAAVSAFRPHYSEAERPQASPLLERVQALGDLHAVKYTYRDIHDFQTSEDPAPWLAALPGADSLVHAATQNSTTMSFDGSVEAGVDLTKAKIQRRPGSVDIVLPEPKVYSPNISASVHEIHRGLVWRDVSITTSAIEDAKARFRETSIRQGILKDAKKNVRERVAGLARDLTREPVTVSFVG